MSDRVAVGAAVDDGAALVVAGGGGVVALALGSGEAPDSDAHAFVSWDSTEKQIDFALGSHAVPSAAVRERDMRMKG